MADRTIEDMLQPSLLDRLTDDEPGSKTEARDARVIDVYRLREIIRRDLAWLLNSNNLGSELDEEKYPEISRSSLNYGVREVSGEFSTKERAELIRASMKVAIERFEPRIREGSLDIELRQVERTCDAMVSFDIVADMWAQPIPLELYLRSEVDVTTGALDLTLER
ncbi:MAG: type VI secretion system baseplate subunit TssE [Verrucomicrobiota bacterium]